MWNKTQLYKYELTYLSSFQSSLVLEHYTKECPDVGDEQLFLQTKINVLIWIYAFRQWRRIIYPDKYTECLVRLFNVFFRRFIESLKIYDATARPRTIIICGPGIILNYVVPSAQVQTKHYHVSWATLTGKDVTTWKQLLKQGWIYWGGCTPPSLGQMGCRVMLFSW